ncbi:hypothetical protein [Peribacillus frigoritolerans]|uniref:hypothetical protein n=1 Tax=Peribacillus frigoritolerans TaxID=450367 RepID=UPI00227FDF36|nr:hypothetical protein [Peribacillus frigoritolerans]MCY9005647.1 hypothetical protein [Peribacillus frigoritolerans]
MLKRLFFILVFLFTYLHLQTYSYATVINIPEKSRVLLKVKDTKGIDYNVYFFAPEETKTDYYLCSTGDEVFVGNYSFLIQKLGEKEIKTTSIILKDYPYNQTQKTVFPIRNKSELYPDIVMVSNQLDCNTKVGYLYYVDNEKLISVQSTLSYTLPPRFNEKNELETMNYYNMEELPWVLSTYSLDLKSNSLKFINKKSLSFEEGQKIKSNW